MQWYYSKNGQQFGPIEIADLNNLYATGQIAPTDLVWNPEMPQWLPAHQIPAISNILTSSISPITSPAQQILNYKIPDECSFVEKDPNQPYYPQQTNSLAVASLVLGILSYCCIIPILCFVPLSFTSIIALIMGIVALRKTRQIYGAPGRGIAITGIVLSSISAAIYLVILLRIFFL